MRAPSKAFAVRVAYSWHGGMSSPLYSFASCGGVIHSEEHRQGLINEVQKALDWTNSHLAAVKAAGNRDREYEQEPHRLGRLLEYIKGAPVKEPVP